MLERIVLEPCFELRAVDRASALAMSACSRPMRSCFYEWIFRNQLYNVGVRTRRTFFRLIKHMRGMGVLPLFSLLHARRAEILLGTYERYLSSQWTIVDPTKFFRMDTQKPPLWRANVLWKVSRDYLQLLHNAASNRRLFSTMALCTTAPEYASRKYGQVLDASNPQGGVLMTLEQMIPHTLWPTHTLRVLLRSLEVRPPPMWRAALESTCANVDASRQRRALQRWRQTIIAPPHTR